MKLFFIFVVLHLAIISIYAQTTSSWPTEARYQKHYRPFLLKIDSKQLEEDFQIRLWFNNGGFSRTSITTLLLIACRNKKWTAIHFTFTKRFLAPDSTIKTTQTEIAITGFDSIFEQLLRDSLLSLKSEEIGAILDSKGIYSYNWRDNPCPVYSIELITPSKQWMLNYPCPKSFYNEFKIGEFEKPNKIVTALLSLIGRTPC